MKARGIIIAALDCAPSAIEAWNRWYDVDHLPPNVALDGIMSGRRYVCTPELHEARPEAPDPWWDGRKSTFLTVYTLCGGVQDTFAGMVGLRDELAAAGRMFDDELKTVRGGDGLTIERTSGTSALRNGPDELPFLGHTGLLVLRSRADCRYADEDHELLAGEVLAVPGCLGVLSCRSQVVPGTGVHLVLLGGSVAESTRAAADALAGGRAAAAFAHSAYEAISPLDYRWAGPLRDVGLSSHP